MIKAEGKLIEVEVCNVASSTNEDWVLVYITGRMSPIYFLREEFEELIELWKTITEGREL